WFAYASAKFEVEAFLDDFERAHADVAVTRLRPGVLVGANMDHVLGRVLRAGFLPYASRTPLPLVWDEDVADAVAIALDRRVAGAFTLAADEPLPAPTLARATGLRPLPLPRLLVKAVNAVARVADSGWTDGAAVVPVFSSEKAKRELGWRPSCATSRE